MTILIKRILSIILVSISWNAAADIVKYFNSIKYDPNALYAFFKAMPKGGELHYHLDGGIYAESMLKLADDHDCIDPKTLGIISSSESCAGVRARQLCSNPKLYETVLRAWSMKDFNSFGSETAQEHFFSTFSKFYLIVQKNVPELLATILQRAAMQHEQYLEIMIVPNNSDISELTQGALDLKNMQIFSEKLLQSKVFNSAVTRTVHQVKRYIPQVKQILHCKQNSQSAACNIMAKFQYAVLREQSLKQVFVQALLGFVAASKSNEIIGMNLVQPEDGYISLNDYQQQMQIFQFLHKKYPQVHIALHAGELNSHAVEPKDLGFHIQDAVFVGNAERIGHGVSIAYENNMEQTLEFMQRHNIAVEINLVSNSIILGIQGTQHPLRFYLSHNIPIVLSSDDEGILRTDLTSQFVVAVVEHDLDYPTIRKINVNTITYSFLPEIEKIKLSKQLKE